MKKKFMIFFIILLVVFDIAFIILTNKSDAPVVGTSSDDIDNGQVVENEVLEVEEKIPKEDINIKVTAIGDIMCHNSQYTDAYIKSNDTYDFSYVFTDIKDYISSADFAIGNLETTFAGKERGYSNYPTFNTPEQLATNLKDFGIDVLSTANNHSLDKGYSGIESTLKFLDEAGISHTGTYSSKEAQNEILVKDVKGIKIAFLSFTYGTNGIPVPNGKEYCINLIDEDLILEHLALAKKQNPDLIFVNMHWGIEYQTKQNQEQEKLADLLFKNGVDVILGSHPHVLQPMEKRTITLEDGSKKDVFVIYSLGNFMSGQTKDNTKNSVILNMEFTKNGETEKTKIDSVSYIPIYMYKSASGSLQKYKVIDIEKNMESFKNGTNKLISQSVYNTINTELTKIRKTMGENIKF